jgi:hypothetical protein
MQTHHPRPLGQLGVSRDEHAALARGDGLVGIKAEHRNITLQRADQAAIASGGQSVRRVLHHLQAMLLGQSQQARHVGRAPRKVHRNDRLGPWRDGAGHRIHIDAKRGCIHIHKYRVCTQVANHLGRGREGVCGGDHLVARSNAHGLQT